MNILAIESSCDETACAVIKDGTEILSSVVATSTAMHEKWGGIVPEVAAREQLASILPVITEALSCFPASPAGRRNNNIKEVIKNNIDAIAVTVGPGLIGSLLIGVETAKTLAYITGKPIIPVNHVLAHMYANFLGSSQTSFARPGLAKLNSIFPAISLVVSGGHTELFLMKNEKELQWLGGTIDDAAGEAFDKTARLLGFGHGGGRAIEEAAKKYQVSSIKHQVKLPRPMMHDETLNFSFSGLKTAILREVQKLQKENEFNEKTIEYLSYEVQEAITDVLIKKTMNAMALHNVTSILISGGVASNICLRNKFIKTMNFHSPPIELCTDNAAFIGSYAYFRGKPIDWHDITAIPDLSVEE